MKTGCKEEFGNIVLNQHDDDTSKHCALSNYNKDGSPEAPHFTGVLL